MATESTIGHLSAHDERELKDFLPPVCDLKDRIRKRKSIHFPSYKVEGFCRCRHCGRMIEVPEGVVLGQNLRCPWCDGKFEYNG